MATETNSYVGTAETVLLDTTEKARDLLFQAPKPNRTDLMQHLALHVPPGKDYAIAINEHPATVLKKPYVPQEDDALIDAGTARANIAPSKEKPDGTTEDDYAERHRHQTVVVQHTDYFDTDNDGVIWISDTYRGCRRFGWNVVLSFVAALIIHGGLSYPTSPSIVPDPFLRLYTKNMHKAKHGSDTMTYDNEGRFRPQAFEDTFAKYDKENKGGLAKSDLYALWRGQMLVGDLFGATAVALEWIATYLLIWPEDGVMKKEDVRGIYDGSIFYKKAEEHERKTRQARRRQGLKGA